MGWLTMATSVLPNWMMTQSRSACDCECVKWVRKYDFEWALSVSRVIFRSTSLSFPHFARKLEMNAKNPRKSLYCLVEMAIDFTGSYPVDSWHPLLYWELANILISNKIPLWTRRFIEFELRHNNRNFRFWKRSAAALSSTAIMLFWFRNSESLKYAKYSRSTNYQCCFTNYAGLVQCEWNACGVQTFGKWNFRCDLFLCREHSLVVARKWEIGSTCIRMLRKCTGMQSPPRTHTHTHSHVDPSFFVMCACLFPFDVFPSFSGSRVHE